ncbi:MAG: hypothetical protein IPK19_32800 [Chloroflexi bacterium]|nr:hypothetical protein [Chloroflexota bacterium]
MSGDILGTVQSLQYTDKRAAERLLVPFIRETFTLDVEDVTLRPSAVSLNSFNGYARLRDGDQVFFKTHIEADNVIDEYYNAELLAHAGYPVLRPLYSSQQSGKQFLIYPMVTCPSVFDVAWEIETGQRAFDPQLITAQQNTDVTLYEIYRRTLQEQPAASARIAPVHQLFYHRLTGGRLDRFYGPGSAISWQDERIPVEEVWKARWIINGTQYDAALAELIAGAIEMLNPTQAGAAVVGHGDAHNGNLFYCEDSSHLTYFDPAFAGTHEPLLDLTKPLFHNVFAMWMYYPTIIDERLHLTLRRDGNVWIVDHDYVIHPIRHAFLESKVTRVLGPILREMSSRELLRPDWRSYLKSALLCCPLLTMNLADSNRFPPQIALLGLAMAVQMGANPVSGSRGLLESALDDVASTLSL